MDDKTFWQELRYMYQLQDYSEIDFNLMKSLFLADREYKEFLMTDKERNHLSTLKAKVTIYRGCAEIEEKNNEFGISWSLSARVAAFFAERKKIQIGNSVIIKRVIDKKEIVAYFDNRNEEEIIYLS